jgi:hypothetical protein
LRELDRADAAIIGFLDAIETSFEEVPALDSEVVGPSRANAARRFLASGRRERHRQSLDAADEV